ncbi:MAG: hypothetical protein GWP59_07200, partial [Chlamydiales bacterium]|nr:hypothetical protein [Chlamydiales bacterium]
DVNGDVDVFVHSWSKDFEKEINDLYQPTAAVFEEQVDFHSTPLLVNQVRHFKSVFPILKKHGIRKGIAQLNKLVHRACSRWYSTKKVVELKKQYERKKGFSYDAVMLIRFDLCFFKKIIFSNYDLNYFYASHRNPVVFKEYSIEAVETIRDEGLALEDLWFFSSSESINAFSELYRSIYDYSIRPPIASKNHVDFLRKPLKYELYRGRDYEMVREFYFSRRH